jgi:hypothetical protein
VVQVLFASPECRTFSTNSHAKSVLCRDVRCALATQRPFDSESALETLMSRDDDDLVV